MMRYVCMYVVFCPPGKKKTYTESELSLAGKVQFHREKKKNRCGYATYMVENLLTCYICNAV